MPAFDARRYPDDIPRVDLLLLSTRLLDPAGSGRHDQGLAERMGMPCRAGTRLERDVSPRRMGRVIFSSLGDARIISDIKLKEANIACDRRGGLGNGFEITCS